MRFRWQSVALAITVVFTGALGAQVSNQGAKELFYDPSDSSVVSSSPSATGGTAATTAHANKARTAKPVRLDRNGRRQVNLASAGSIQAAQPAAVHASQGTQKVLGISYWIELMDGKGGPGTQVTNERIFHSGERIRLHFRGNAEGHIALLQLGSSGAGTVLFPDPEKQLTDSVLIANEDRILPSAEHWFRFDDNPGTERLLVFFARSREDLDHFPANSALDEQATGTLVATAKSIQGSKDLMIETETRKASEIGTYGVNVAGRPVVLEITLKHR